jgi:hypothetical protein
MSAAQTSSTTDGVASRVKDILVQAVTTLGVLGGATVWVGLWVLMGRYRYVQGDYLSAGFIALVLVVPALVLTGRHLARVFGIEGPVEPAEWDRSADPTEWDISVRPSEWDLSLSSN